MQPPCVREVVARIGSDPLGARIQEVARYGQTYKDRIVARLLPPESSSVEQLSREVGVSAATLERWRAGALAHGSGDRTGGSQRWTAAARLQALITTAGMDEATRSGWCREQGLYPAELAAWQQDAIAGLGEPRAVSAAEAPLCVREVVARIGSEPLGARTSGSGSIRTGVQGSDSGATVAAGEFVGGASVSRGWSECSDPGALACGCVGQRVW